MFIKMTPQLNVTRALAGIVFKQRQGCSYVWTGTVYKQRCPIFEGDIKKVTITRPYRSYLANLALQILRPAMGLTLN